MRLLRLAPLLVLAGCQTVTLNGQDIGRATAATAIGVLAIGLAIDAAQDDPPEEEGVYYACRFCPPPVPVEPLPGGP